MENEESDIDIEPTPWGILKQTLIPSSVIHKIVLLRGSTGELCVVVVRETTVIVNNSRPVPLPAPILACDVLKSSPIEDFLLLTLKSGWLLVVRIFPNGDTPLVLTSYKMGPEFSGANDLGIRIAVESQGRFFAISDSNKRVRIMAFGSPGDKNSLNNLSNSSQDIQSRHTISLGSGVVLNMAFLTASSSASSNNSSATSLAVGPIPSQQVSGSKVSLGDVFLVVLYAVSRKLKLNMYKVPYGQREYIHDTGLCGTFTLALDYNKEIPLYMVPVTVKDSSAIVLVTENQVLLVTFLDIMSGHRLLTSFSLPDYPLAVHQFPYDDNKSIFYFTTKLGHLYRVKVSEKRGFELTCLVKWPNRDLGSSFVIQPYDEELGTIDNCSIMNADRILITFGGDLCTGGSIVFKSLGIIEDSLDSDQQDSQEIDTFDNWAPISDFKALNIHSTTRGDSLELFACTGLNDTGAVTQFRHGFRASIFLQGPSMKEAPNLFSLKSYDGSDCYLVVSFPWMTSLYLVDSENSQSDNTDNDHLPSDYFPQLSEVPTNNGIDCNAETKAISFLPQSKLAVQVTTSQIILSDLLGFSLKLDTPKISCASILGNLIAIAFYDELTYTNKISVYILHAPNNINGEDIMDFNWIDEFPCNITSASPISFVKFIKVGDNEINLFIGSYEPKIIAYNVNIDILHLRLVFEITDIFRTQEDVPNDIYFQNVNSTPTYIIGLRNGTYLHCTWNNSSLKIDNKRKLGNLPIQFITLQGVNQDAVNVSHASKTVLFSNGKLSCFDSNNLSDAPQRVIVDVDKVSEIRSVCQFFSEVDDSKHQFIAVIMNNRLMILVLDQFATIIPKQVRLGSTPKRLMYMDHICAFVTILAPTPSELIVPPKTHLRFVDPKRMTEISWRLDDATINTPKVTFLPNEIINSACEWSIEIDGNLYKFLVLGSGIWGLPEGRIRILRVSRNTRGIIATMQHSWKTGGPVYSISQFKNL